MNALENAIAICGSQTGLSAALKVAPQVVSNWIRRGSVPAERCPAIERATGGAVRCEELRPDVDWGYLRGTSVPVGEGEALQPPSPQRPLPTSGQGANPGCQTDDQESTAAQVAIVAQLLAGAKRTGADECGLSEGSSCV